MKRAALLALSLVLAGCGTVAKIAEPGVYLRAAKPFTMVPMVPDGPGRWTEGKDPVTVPALSYVLPASAGQPTTAPSR